MLKQLFCKHKYKIRRIDKNYYATIGDEHHGIKSNKFTLICDKCDHKITFVDRWGLNS